MADSADGQKWVVGASIADDERLARLRSVLEESFVIVEHRFYLGSRAPTYLWSTTLMTSAGTFGRRHTPATRCGSGVTTNCAETTIPSLKARSQINAA